MSNFRKLIEKMVRKLLDSVWGCFNNRVNRATNSGEVAIGLIVISGLVLVLIGGGMLTQYMKTQVIGLGTGEIQRDFTFTVPNNLDLIGEHAVNFTTTDGVDIFTSDPVTVVVTAQNLPPEVSVGDDLIVRMPLEITLSGVVADDGLPYVPGEVTYQWSKVSGPGDVSFGDVAALETTASFSVAGTYVLRLTADDGKVSAYDELSVLAEPAPPAPDLSLQADKSLMAINDTVVIDVRIVEAASFANWAQYLEFDNTKLELIDQQTGDFSTFIADTRGLTTINSSGQVRAGGFSLTDSNSGGGVLGIFTFKAIGEGQTTVSTANKSSSNLFGNAISETDGYEILPDIIIGEVSLTILNENTAPTVSAGDDQEIQLPTNSVSLSGNVSDDGLPQPPGAVSLLWSKVSGIGDVTFSAASEVNTTATFSGAGVYILRLFADDGGLSVYDDVTVLVVEANQAPIASNDSYDAKQDEILTVDKPGVLSNDTDPDNNALIVIDLVSTTNGVLKLNTDGSFTYTPKSGYYGKDQGQYKAFDGTLKSEYATVEFTVEQKNEPPIVSAGDDQDVNLPNVVLLSGSVTDDGLPQPPGAVSLLWSKVSGIGDVTFSAASEVNTTATFSGAGVYILQLIADDGELTISDEVVVTVNTVPTGRSDNYEVWRSDELNINFPGVLENDTDFDGDSLTAKLVSDVAIESGVLEFNENGSFNFLPAGDFRGVASFTYQATDGKAFSADTTVEIVVKVRNFAPQVNAGNDQVISFPEGTTLVGSVVDDGEPLGGSVVSLWTKVSGPGEVTFGNTGLLVTTANFNTAGLYVLRLSATDGELSAHDEVKIIVNTLPVGNNDVFEVLRGQLLTIVAPGVLENDIDADNDPLTADLVDDAKLGELNLKSDGSFTYIYDPSDDGCYYENGQISTPVSCDNPNCNIGPCKKFAPWEDWFTYISTDGKGQSEVNRVDITINVVNAAPIVNAGEDQVVAISEGAILSGEVTDDGLPDPPNTMITQWMMVSGPGDVTFGAANERETTAEFTQSGEYTLRLSASDSEYLIADEVVIEVNSEPLVDAGEDVTVLINEDAELTGLVNNDGIPKSGTVVVQWTQVSGPAQADISDVLLANTAAIFSVPGDYVLRLTADDGHLTAFDEITITAVARYAEVIIPGQTLYNVRPGETVEIPFEIRTNIIDVARLLITMTKNIYFSAIE